MQRLARTHVHHISLLHTAGYGLLNLVSFRFLNPPPPHHPLVSMQRLH